MKILYFYPENPLLFTQGNNARANKLLEYFKTRNIEVDFVGEETREFTIQDSNELVKTNLVKRSFLLKSFRRSKNQLKYFFFKSLPRLLKGEFKEFPQVGFGAINYIKTNVSEYKFKRDLRIQLEYDNYSTTEIDTKEGIENTKITI